MFYIVELQRTRGAPSCYLGENAVGCLDPMQAKRFDTQEAAQFVVDVIRSFTECGDQGTVINMPYAQ